MHRLERMAAQERSRQTLCPLSTRLLIGISLASAEQLMRADGGKCEAVAVWLQMSLGKAEHIRSLTVSLLRLTQGAMVWRVALDELPLRSFDTETGQRQQNPAGETAFRLALLAAALGLVSFTVVGGGFEIARRAGQPFLRASWRAVAGLPASLRRMRSDLINLTDIGPVQERYAVRRAPRPADPVQDLKGSLSELMGDLRRATAASYSPRSFAPPARQMHKRATDKNQASFEARFGCGRDEGRVVNPAAERAHEVLEIPAIV
jgi:hypothetical protein